MEKAFFGAGCFWHVEEAFRALKGVTQTRVGYMGGKSKNPTYEQVCSDETGHIEVCEVTFEPKIIAYPELLDVFWKIHDPTQLNRQGPDIGTQYKSVIFYCTKKQQESAIKSKDDIQKKVVDAIVTSIEKADVFYPAEEYHQKYLMKKGKKTCGF